MKKTQRRLEQRKEQILEEAKKILIKNGKLTTMGDIAHALNMEPSGLYYYYKNIPEILDTILDQEYHDFSLENILWKGFKGGAIEKAKAMVKMILEFYYDNQEILHIVFMQVFPLCVPPEHTDDSVAINHFLKTYHEANESLLSEIKLSQKEGTLDKSLNPETILYSIRGFIFGIWASWEKNKPGREDIPHIVERLFKTFV